MFDQNNLKITTESLFTLVYGPAEPLFTLELTIVQSK